MHRHEPNPYSFRTTHWSVVEQLRQSDPAVQRAALDALCAFYHAPILAFFGAHGLSDADASDAAQSFQTDVLLQRQLLRSADPKCGRLRALLLASLRNYAIDLTRKAKVRYSVDENRDAPGGDADAGQAAFDREWAAAIVRDAHARCEHYFRSAGKSGHWDLFEARVITPATRPASAPHLETLAPRCGFDSAHAAAAALQVVRRRFQEFLREAVAEHANGESEIESELGVVRASLLRR